MIFIFVAPIVRLTRDANPLWDKMPVRIIAFGDQMYGIWILTIIILAAILLITSWREAERKASLGE